MMAALDVEKSADHVRWLTDHTPSRISGMGQDREAAEYICKKIEEYEVGAEYCAGTAPCADAGDAAIAGMPANVRT